jgi:DUF1365 family protein
VTAGALYTGATRHRRLSPKAHSFRSSLYLVLLDHDELDRPDGPTRRGGPLGPERWWPVHYRRSDYLDGDPSTPLGTSVRDLVEARTGRRPLGPVRTLTQVRTEGYVFNPITVHYCLAPEGGTAADRDEGPVLEVVVLEVTNTPWHERHCYVIDARPDTDPSTAPGPVAAGTLDRRGRLHAQMAKALHVSPFMPMDQTYRLTCTAPGPRLWLRLETFEQSPDGEPTKVFDADLAVRRSPLTREGLARRLFTHPFATYKVWLGIHAQAVALATERVPFFGHPDRTGLDRPVIGAGPRGKVDRA